jgi:hypothetical protein
VISRVFRAKSSTSNINRCLLASPNPSPSCIWMPVPEMSMLPTARKKGLHRRLCMLAKAAPSGHTLGRHACMLFSTLVSLGHGGGSAPAALSLGRGGGSAPTPCSLICGGDSAAAATHLTIGGLGKGVATAI